MCHAVEQLPYCHADDNLFLLKHMELLVVQSMVNIITTLNVPFMEIECKSLYILFIKLCEINVYFLLLFYG